MTHRGNTSASPHRVQPSPHPTSATAAVLATAFLFLLYGQPFSNLTGRTSGLLGENQASAVMEAPMSVEVPAADSALVAGWGPIAFYGGVVKTAPFQARYELILVRRGASGVGSEERVT